MSAIRASVVVGTSNDSAANQLHSGSTQLERVVADALLHAGSVRAVAELGVSPNTVRKYVRAHAWPTETNRSRFNETRWDRLGREADQGRL